MKFDKPIKIKHIKGEGNIEFAYLADYNEGESIYNKTYSISNNDLDTVKELLNKELNFKYNFGIKIYNTEGTAVTSYQYCARLDLTYTNSFNLSEFETLINKYITKEVEDNRAKVNFITIGEEGIGSISKVLPKIINIDIENSYESNFDINKLFDLIEAEKSGLIILSGIPGSGKSTLIKYMAQEIKTRPFYYMSLDSLNILSSPRFTNFCLNHLINSVLVLEDCEKLLLSRNINMGSGISTILNITDGIIGDLLNIKIITTLNTSDKIDSALLRKGRLLCQCDFKELTIEKIKNLSKNLNIEVNLEKPISLCEVYNQEDNGNLVKTNEVGFKVAC